MLPIIFQHVRELAEAHSAVAENGRYKIITPFPPSGGDWPDFRKETLTFGEPPAEGDSASEDTLRAYEFYKSTDNLYYDYSYGIKSDEYFLSQICHKFFLNAQPDTTDISFRTLFAEKKDAFLNKYLRSTAGDLGRYDFRYTSPSPLSWNADKIKLNSSETERLKAKATSLYEDLELEHLPFVKSLIDDIKSSAYSAVEYEFGFFDVIREWVNPHLFEGKWAFSSGSNVLYGEADPFLANNGDVKLCYAQRFYLVKNYAATQMVSPLPVREHRFEVTDDDRRPGLHRRKVRNELIGLRVAKMWNPPKPMDAPMPVPQPRPGFVWIPATGAVPGHWERERAGGLPQPAHDSRYKVAAIRCRVLPPKP
jgi:hypothetical protein